MKGQLTDLDNPVAPGGSTKITISVDAFKRWMRQSGFIEAMANVNQEVFFIHQGPSRMIDNQLVTPNWHITAMTTQRSGGDCRNFHFKIEIGKAASHYWHYVVHYHPTAQTFAWVGDPNPLAPSTNQGGGGAAGNLQLLKQNLEETESTARIYGLDGVVTKRTQVKMLRVLKQMVDSRSLTLNGTRID